MPMSEMSTHYRACHLCEAICGVEIKTRGDQIVSIKGDKMDPFSRGHICPKAIAIQDIHNDPDRLRQPLQRVDRNGSSQWEPISWEEAFKRIGEQLNQIQRQYGRDAVAFFAGNPNVHNFGSMTHLAPLLRLFKTRNLYSATSLDQLPVHLTSYLMYGHKDMIPVPDIDATRFMLIIGANPMASNGSIMTVPDVAKRLRAIQQRGGELVVIDPRRTETAAIADRHYFIRPGTDALLLLAMINALFEENRVDTGHLTDKLVGLAAVQEAVKAFTPENTAAATGVDAGIARMLARALASAHGGVCYGRMGVSTQAFGTLCQWAIQILNILTANLDRTGGTLVTHPAFGMVVPGPSGRGHFGRWASRVSGLPEFSGELPSTVLAEEILTPGEGQVRALLTMAGNPVLSAPNGRQLDLGLEQLDFMVSIDVYINETTRHADIILPPTSPLEHDHYDIAFNRLAVRNVARYNAPVFEPAPESLHDWQVLNGIAAHYAAVGETDFKPAPEPHQIVDHGIRKGFYSEAAGHPLALTLDKLREYPHGLDLGPLQPSLSERICTDDGMIQLAPEIIVRDISRAFEFISSLPERTRDQQLLLIGRRHVRSNNSWMHNARRLIKGKPRWQLLMHPRDMRARQISNGEKVHIRSRIGRVSVEVVASEEMMPGVVSLPHGWGHQRQGVRLNIASEQGGVSCNDLTDHKLYDAVSGNSALNGVPVEIFKLEPAHV